MHMRDLVDRFPAQLTEAITIGAGATIKKHSQDIHNVYVAGLGGSGIGADFVREFVQEECPVPIIVGKGYDTPAFIGKNTLAICSSFSGNTEETLHAFDQLLASGAKIVIISSGGKLIELAKEHRLDFIQVPGNWPSPRACLGYSLVQQLFVLHKLGLISGRSIDEVKAAINLLQFDQDEIKKDARTIASKLDKKIPVIYTTDRMESVAVRFRQQVNENAKMLCWHHVIPEMNHNELVGWRDKHKDLAVIYFRNKDDFKRNSIRMDINKEIISKYTSTIIEVFSKGKNLIERALYFVHLGDYISCDMADLHGVDAIEVDVINYLKGELAKV